jgi:hypothetical protein
MTDEPIASHSFCVIGGCSAPATTSRWFTTSDGDQHEIEVCWTHEDNALTIEDLDPDKIDWTGGGAG